MGTELEHSRVTTNGIEMHVVQAGPRDGLPIVLLHGFPEGWESWRGVMERLAARYRVIAPDLRGYGQTEKPANGYDFLSLTDDISGLLDALELESPVLVGHDWGGALAWLCGHRFGARLRQLVVVNCTHPRTLMRGIIRGQDWQHARSFYVGVFQVPGLAERMLTAAGGALLRRSMLAMEGRKGAMDRAVVDELASHFRTPDDLRGPLAYYREFARAQWDRDLRNALHFTWNQPIGCPATMIWGDQDRALSMDVARMSERDAGIPVAWKTLAGVGHFVSLEVPDLLASELAAVVGDPAAAVSEAPSA